MGPSRSPAPAFAVAGTLGAVHAVVDATTVAAVFRAIPALSPGSLDGFGLVLAYDALAFGAQAPLGLLVDARRLARPAALAGVVLSALALAASGVTALATLALAGLGNALYHVGAGATVLRSNAGRSAPAGAFVAPGALGLGLGLHLGRNAGAPAWPLLVACAAGLALVAALRAPEDSEAAAAAPRTAAPPAVAAALVVALCFVSVAVRSYVGCAAPAALPKGTSLAVALPVAGFTGKLLGGLAADRLGRIGVGVGALVVSAPLLALGGHQPPVLAAGLLVFQMTMPITLLAVAEALPRRPALAFGILSIAILAGALPSFLDPGNHAATGGTFLVLVLGSAAALWQALRLAERPSLAAARAADGVPGDP